MNNKYKVCVYAICKNEEQFVDIWMDHETGKSLVRKLNTRPVHLQLEFQSRRNTHSAVHPSKNPFPPQLQVDLSHT